MLTVDLHRGKCKLLARLLVLLLTISNFTVLYGQQEAAIEAVFLKPKEIESHPDPDISDLGEIDREASVTLLFLKNFPIEERIVYSYKRSGEKDNSVKAVREFSIKKDGIIKAYRDGKMVPLVAMGSRGFLPGEKITCKFSTKDGDFEKCISFIPTPLSSKYTSDGATITAEAISYLPVAFYRFDFAGFNDNEKLNFVSISGKERIEKSFAPNADGKNGLLTTPDTLEHKGGVGTVTFTRGTGEKLQFDLPWGLELLDYLQGKKIYINP